MSSESVDHSMPEPMPDRGHSKMVLIVDDVPENLAVLHDALDESGYMVLVANNGAVALERAEQLQPDIILLDAMMPGMDGFEVCRRLKSSMKTRNIPIIFMTGLTEAEHVAAAFEAGGTDYVTKPIRPKEVLARITSHLQTARMMLQARSALDAFGQAAIAITPQDGKIVWQTPLARSWLQRYFLSENPMLELTPPVLANWIMQAYNANLLASNSLSAAALSLASSLNSGYFGYPAEQANAGKALEPMTVMQGTNRLIFTPADLSSSEQWIIFLREESDAAQIEALMVTFKLTMRESEVLYWATKGKTNRDIGDILGTSPRTVNKHLEHVYVKLGVETRTAAASLVTSKIRAIK